jgi:hypothetical protein
MISVCCEQYGEAHRNIDFKIAFVFEQYDDTDTYMAFVIFIVCEFMTGLTGSSCLNIYVEYKNVMNVLRNTKHGWDLRCSGILSNVEL